VDNPKLDKALLQAESDYICDPHGRDIEYWHQEYLERIGVDLEWTRKQAIEHRWRERRQSYWRGVQAAWLRQQQQALLQARASELHDATDLHQQLFGLIRPKMVGNTLVFPVQPKSYEGLLKAWLKLSEVVDHRREQILRQMDPMLGRAEAELASTESKPQLPFTGEEMRHLAHNLLASRRERRRADLMIEEQDETATVESGSVEGEGGVEGEDGSGRHERAEGVDR
jgi:hypothetical protein